MIRLLYVMIIFSVYLMGCGQPPVLQVNGFEGYVEDFRVHAENEGRQLTINNLIIEFGDLGETTKRAHCKISDGLPPTIVVDEYHWSQYNEVQREMILFHELGHCVLHRLHDEKTDHEGHPASLMNPRLFNHEVYLQEHEDFIAELFSHAPQF